MPKEEMFIVLEELVGLSYHKKYSVDTSSIQNRGKYFAHWERILTQGIENFKHKDCPIMVKIFKFISM